MGAYLRGNLFRGGGLFEGGFIRRWGLIRGFMLLYPCYAFRCHAFSFPHFVQGFGFIDLSNINVAMEVLSGPVLVRGGRRVVRPKVLILKTDFLQQGVQYLINLEVTNADGKSNAKMLVRTPSPPVPGK